MKLRIMISVGLLSLYGASALSMKRGRTDKQKSKGSRGSARMKKLKAKQLEPNDRLLAISKGESVQFVRDLLDSGISLHHACRHGDFALVQLLLDRGASVEAQTIGDATPLHIAARVGDVGVCELLIGKGASVEAQMESGATPLHIAVQCGHVGMCGLLVGKGASLEAQTKDGVTPLHLAAQCGHVGVCKFLVDKGASLNALSNRDLLFGETCIGEFTPLHQAVFFGKQDVVELLLKNKADIHAKTQDERTVLDIARQRGHKDLIVYLENYLKEKAPLNGSLDQLVAVAVEESADLLEVIEQGDVNGVSNLLQSNTYTADELKAAFLKAQESGNHAIVGLLISTGGIPLQNIALAPEFKKVWVKE